MKNVIDWKKIMQTWYEPLRFILEQNEMAELMYILYKEYHVTDNTVYPNPKSIFRVFKECPYEELKVVIIGQDPYPDGSYTGIAFANEGRNPSAYSPSLKKIWERISIDFHSGDYKEFDPTLISWTKQGIMPINSAFTVQKGLPRSHTRLWNKFTASFLQVLSEKKPGIFYCLWGKVAQDFSKNICKSDNFLLTCTHPAYACYRNMIWECDNFKVVNEKLKELGKKTIKW